MRVAIRGFDKTVIAPLALGLALRRPRRPPAAATGGGHSVVIKLVGMGDAVLLLPALAALRARGDRVTVITTARCRAIFAADGVADEVLTLSAGGWATGLARLWRALRSADRVLDFEQHIYWSAGLAAAARGAAVRYGLRTRSAPRNRVYDILVDPGKAPRPMKEIFDDLARRAGAAPAAGLLPLPVRPAVAAGVAAWMAGQGLHPRSFSVIAPGSGGTVAFRRLSAAQWAPVVRHLAMDGPVVLVGTAIEAGIIGEIERCAPPVITQMGFRLEELAAFFAAAGVVLAIDSGPMHLAAAMGAPVVGIFGPDTPARYAPYSARARSVWLGLSCSPCNNCFIYREARCTNPDPYACIQGITTENIMAAATAVRAMRAAR